MWFEEISSCKTANIINMHGMNNIRFKNKNAPVVASAYETYDYWKFYDENPAVMMTTVVLAAYFLLVVKVKFTLEQAMTAQKGSRGIALLFL